MTSPTASPVELDPLQAAVAAEEALWDLSQAHPQQWLAVRNAAIKAAVASGYTPGDVASALQMRPTDVQRLLNS